MLLAVSVAAGGILATNSEACSAGASGFPYGSVELSDFGYSEGGMDILVANNDPQQLDQTLTGVNIVNSETGNELQITDIETLEYGRTSTLRLPNVTKVNDCNTFDVQINYERGSEVRSQSVSGQIEAQLAINGTHIEPYTGPFSNFQSSILDVESPVVRGNEFNVTAEVENLGTLEGSQDIRFNFSSSQKTETATLGFGETKKMEKKFTAPDETGVYRIWVKTDNDTASAPVEVQTVQPRQLTVDIQDYDSSDFLETAEVELISEGSVLETRSVSNGETTFDKTPGEYRINVSNPEYFEVSGTVNLQSDTTEQITMHKIPQIQNFQVTDRSECVQYLFVGLCIDRDVIYDVEWTAGEPNGHGIETNVSYDGSEQFEGFSSSETIQRDGGWEQEHTLTLRAGYDHYGICARYTDTADGNDPESYSSC